LNKNFLNNLENDIDELYDLDFDPGEMVNLINNPKYKKVLNQLRKELDKLKKELKYHDDRDFWLRKQAPIWDAKYASKKEKK